MYKWNWFNKYGGWVALAAMLAFLIILFSSCTQLGKPTQVLPEVAPQKSEYQIWKERTHKVVGYQVNMGTHHLINADTLKEAEEFVATQSAHHAQPLTILTKMVKFSRPHYGRND